MSAMPATPPRRSASATTRATCSGSAGPGSITQAGSPTIQVLVPDSVIGPAFARAHQRDAVGDSFCDRGHGSSIGHTLGSAL